MNCKDVSGLLIAYLDNEVTSDEGEQIRAHLSTCPRCREELEALSATQNSLRRALEVTAAEATPSSQAWAGIRQQLAAEEQPRVTIWDLVKSKLKGGKDIMIRGLVSRQPVWKMTVIGILAVALVVGLSLTIPSTTQSVYAEAAEIVQNSPQVWAALGDGEVKVVKLINFVDGKGTVICQGELGVITAEVDLETSEVKVLTMPELTGADEQVAIDIAKADPRVRELLDQGASIGEVSPMYSFGAWLNPETGEIEEFSGALVRVEIELGEKTWVAHIDLTEGEVVELMERTTISIDSMRMESSSTPEGGIEYFHIEMGPIE